MNPDHWDMEFYEDPDGKEPCKDFIENLDEPKAAAIRGALVYILARQGPTVCDSEFGKNLKKGLYEFRLRHTESEVLRRVRPDLEDKVRDASDPKVLLRVFFHPHGNKLILLLGGYDKGADPKDRRQRSEIARARRALAAWQADQRRSSGSAEGGPRTPSKGSFRTYWRGFRR